MTPSTQDDLLERLRPRFVDSIPVEIAITELRDRQYSGTADELSAWLFANNGLRGDAATQISELQGEVERLTKERDEAREASAEFQAEMGRMADTIERDRASLAMAMEALKSISNIAYNMARRPAGWVAEEQFERIRQIADTAIAHHKAGET